MVLGALSFVWMVRQVLALLGRKERRNESYVLRGWFVRHLLLRIYHYIRGAVVMELIFWAIASTIVLASMWYIDRKPYPKPSRKFQAHPVDEGEVGRFR